MFTISTSLLFSLLNKFGWSSDSSDLFFFNDIAGLQVIMSRRTDGQSNKNKSPSCDTSVFLYQHNVLTVSKLSAQLNVKCLFPKYNVRGRKDSVESRFQHGSNVHTIPTNLCIHTGWKLTVYTHITHGLTAGHVWKHCVLDCAP